MRVGFIVDGEAEYRALPGVYERLGVTATLLAPLKSDIQPLAPLRQIIGAVRIPLRIMRARGADLVIVLIDRETRDECAGAIASSIESALVQSCPLRISVVIKNRRFENWLLADPDALQQLKGRFKLESGHRSQIEPDKADHVDGLALLKRIVRQHDYSKVKDAVQILSRADPARMARNSRSFRRLMRVLGHGKYLSQSRLP